jgi:hypothetical protein
MSVSSEFWTARVTRLERCQMQFDLERRKMYERYLRGIPQSDGTLDAAVASFASPSSSSPSSACRSLGSIILRWMAGGRGFTAYMSDQARVQSRRSRQGAIRSLASADFSNPSSRTPRKRRKLQYNTCVGCSIGKCKSNGTYITWWHASHPCKLPTRLFRSAVSYRP